MKLLSYSAIRGFSTCEARQVAIDRKEYEFPQTTAMRQGKVLEAALCGTEMPTGTTKKNGELYKDFATILELAERMKSDPLVIEHLRGEQQVEKENEHFKGIADLVTDTEIIDIKKAQSLRQLVWSDEHGTKVPIWIANMWHWQMAIYQELFGQDKEYKLLVGTSETPGDFGILKFANNDLKAIYKAEIEPNVEHWLSVRNGETEPKRCEKCDYCRSTRKAEIITINLYLGI